MNRILLACLIILSLAAVAMAGAALHATSSPPAQAPAPVQADRPDAQVAGLQKRVADLEARVEELRNKPAPVADAAPPAAPAAAIDDAHIKTVVAAELQAQFERMRSQFGGGGGAGGGWGGPPALGDAATVKTQLGVDDQKAEQTAKIVADMRSAVRDLWRGGGDRDANMKKMQDLRTEAETKLAEVLSAEELAKAKQLLDQPAGRRGRGGPGPGGGGGPGGQGGDLPPANQPKGTSF